MEKKEIKKIIFGLVAAFIGCSVSAISINLIIRPNGLNGIGLTGLSIIIEQLTGLNYTYIYYGGAALILVATALTIGKKQAIKILYLSILFPTMLLVFQKTGLEIIFEEKMVAAVFAGVISGIGSGICFRFGFSYGGTDSVAKIIHRKLLPFINLAQILLIVDGVVVVCTGIVFGVEVAVYSLITQFIVMKVVDYVMFGIGLTLVKLEIVTPNNDAVAKYIMNEIRRGVTLSHVTGGYTKTERVKVTCICSPKESVEIKKFVAKIDEKPHIVVTQVARVWGAGRRFESLTDD